MRMRCRVQYLEEGGVRIMCGPDPEVICQVEGCYENHVALCDYPTVDWKTCDKRMCSTHRTRIGENVDYCADHAEATAQTPMNQRP